jgi:4-hydroxy-tetrahydrodipicolinate reductase
MNSLPTIAIVGYGSMGKEIETLAKEQNYNIGAIFDIDSPLSSAGNYNFDIAIDFSLPEAVVSNVEILTSKKKSIIIGTTGWYSKIDKIRQIVEESGIGLVYGSNFSVGMQIFFRIVRKAASLLNNTQDYDIMLHELHHHKKKDSPSGTALSLAKIIQEEFHSKSKLLIDTSHGKIEPDQLHVTSTRGGEITGTHTIYIDSIADTIELTHRAKNRSGFAMGALMAAKWLYGKSGFYDFNEVFESLLNR